MNHASPETVIVKDSKFGKGIFTTTNLQKNTILFKITGDPLSFEDTIKMDDKECYCLHTGINKYIIPHYPFKFSNHSCKPNCGISNNLELHTLINVDAGEELVWDYSTSMLEKHWTMRCRCGHPECRNIITDFDLIPQKVQDKYLHLGIVLTFMLRVFTGLP